MASEKQRYDFSFKVVVFHARLFVLRHHQPLNQNVEARVSFRQIKSQQDLQGLYKKMYLLRFSGEEGFLWKGLIGSNECHRVGQ